MEPQTKENNNKLLLLGLELLKNFNKSAKLPYAVVKPRVQVSLGESEQGQGTVADEYSMSGNDRKRKHSEEPSETVHKKEKRRMMNRIAAQNARDRKKEHLEIIENKLALLEKQNRLLSLENQKLKEHTSTLEAEKKSLENKLCSQQPDNLSNADDGLDNSTMECFNGSAVSEVSQQKKHTPLSVLQTYLSVNLISWVYCMKSWETNPQLNAQEVLTSFMAYETSQIQKQKSTLPTTMSLPTRMEVWWGAHNPGWNPPLN